MCDFLSQSVMLKILLTGMLLITAMAADEKPVEGVNVSRKVEDSIKPLKPFAAWVGEWRGVVQPRRGSSAGAWTEKATVSWKLAEAKPEMVLHMEPGKQLRTLRLLADSGATGLSAILEDSEGRELRLTREDANAGGQVPATDAAKAESTWVFVSDGEAERQRRVTVRLLSRIRVTLLLEERVSGTAAWKRVSECGLTRAGERLAAGGTGEKECIVTGGLGSIPVAFDGSTFFVCCEGCRQVFDEDPMGTIAAYRERLRGETADQGNPDR